ncbi:MAG: L-fuconate dehydratase [Saprospiraceae bacterium]
MEFNIEIKDIEIKDIRFPTSKYLDGSDAMNPNPDYSAAYVILKTNHPQAIEGHGLTFTIGRGNELCVAAIQSLSHLLIGKSLNDIVNDMAGFGRRSQAIANYDGWDLKRVSFIWQLVLS